MRFNILFKLAFAVLCTSFSYHLPASSNSDMKESIGGQVESEVVLDGGILSDDIPPVPDKKTRYAIMTHYFDGSYFLPGYEENDEARRVPSPQERAMAEAKARVETKTRVGARRQNVIEKAGIDESQFVRASLYIALTEKNLPKLDLSILIYDIAFVDTLEAAKALETIDRNLEQIATRILDLDNLNLRRSYNVPEESHDAEFVELLRKYRKTGYVPELDEKKVQSNIFTFLQSTRYVIIAAARESQNRNLIPLLSRYLSFDGENGHLATTAQNALDSMAVIDASK